MIPLHSADLGALLDEVEHQSGEVEALFSHHSTGALTWRPDPGRWSVTGHLAHLCIVNEPYLTSMEGALTEARRRGGAAGDGPYRHPRIASWFVRSLEPPPKRRIKTFRSMVPDPVTDPHSVLPGFLALQGQLTELMEAARGVDLGRVRFGSPFLSLLRLSLGTGFELILAHNRRHLWLVRELMGVDGFPGGAAE